MPDYSRDAEQIEREIVRMGLVLGIDWNDEVQVRALAREALAYHDGEAAAYRADSTRTQAKLDLFGLVQLMLNVMRQSANEGSETHGGPVWKVFARALWQEEEAKGR